MHTYSYIMAAWCRTNKEVALHARYLMVQYDKFQNSPCSGWALKAQAIDADAWILQLCRGNIHAVQDFVMQCAGNAVSQKNVFRISWELIHMSTTWPERLHAQSNTQVCS